MMSSSSAPSDQTPACPTCGTTRPRNDFGLCPGCGADLSAGDLGGRGPDQSVVLPVPGLGGALRVAPSTLLSAPKLLHHGRRLERQRGVFHVPTRSGTTLQVRVKPRFVDPYPRVLVDGVKLPYGDPLPWYASLLAFLPVVLMLSGGCAGVAFGAMASGVCIKALRSQRSGFGRYGVALVINGVALTLGVILLLLKVAAFVPPAVDDTSRTVTSDSGLSQIDVPTSWSAMPQLVPGADLAFGSERADEYLIVLTEPIEGLDAGVTLRDYAELIRPDFAGAQYGDLLPLTIAGREALQREVNATIEGNAATILHTVVDTGPDVYQVWVWTSRHNFPRRRDAFRALTSTFTTPHIAAVASLSAQGAAFPSVALRAATPSTLRTPRPPEPVPSPPGEFFEQVRYPAPLGANAALVTPVVEGQRRAAIIWIVGGFYWGLSEVAWEAAPRSNDQSARAFREAGMVMMLPALRGTHDNPGDLECFRGEVDDILAAVDYLRTRPDVDPQRIFLGGHSSGATLVLLAASSTDAFRGVVAFGPTPDPAWYGDGGCLIPGVPEAELALRAPVNFLRFVRSPTYLIEGEAGNAWALSVLQRHAGGAPVESIMVPGANHFDVLAPGTEVAAAWMTSADLQAAVTLDAILARLAVAP